jgi:hypothetical protein
VSGEAFEIDGPEGERDEEPIVDVPNQIGLPQLGDLGSEAVEFFGQGAAMGSPAERELVEVTEVRLERARHGGSLKAKVKRQKDGKDVKDIRDEQEHSTANDRPPIKSEVRIVK